MFGVGVRSFVVCKCVSHIFEMFLHSFFEVPFSIANVDFACVFAFHFVHHNFVPTDIVVVTAFGFLGPEIAS